MSLLFFDEVLRGVEASADQASELVSLDHEKGAEASDPDLPRVACSLAGKVDAALIGEGIVPSAACLARLAERLPVVVIAGNPRGRAADVVTADNRAGVGGARDRT